MMHDFPYTNYHDLNADWIVDQLGDLKDSKEAAAASATAAAESATAAAASEESAQNNAEMIQSAADQLELLNARVENLVSANTGTKINTVRVTSVTPVDGIATATFNVPEGYGILEALTKDHGTAIWTTGCGINEQNNVITLTRETAAVTDFMLIYSSTEAVPNAEVEDIRIGYDGTTYPSAGDAVRGQVNELHEELSETNNTISEVVEKSPNLFDKYNDSSYTEGIALNANNDTTIEYANMCTTDYIPVHVNEWYSFLGATAYYGSSNVIKVHIYKADKSYIGRIDGILDSSTNVVKFPCNPSVFYTNDQFVRVSFLKRDLDKFMFVKGEYPTKYQAYGEYHVTDNLVLPSILNSKNIALNGDSICAGTGDAVGGFGKLIADAENMTYQNIAVAGGSISYVSGRHCIARTMGNLNNSDYVIFEGGINDKALNVPFGEISSGYSASLDDTTFCGAFESCCKTLVENYTTCKYGYVFVHNMALDPDWNAVWRPTMKSILDKWGVPYIDLQTEIPPLNFIDSLKSIYTNNGDGWHPNLLGYETFYVDKITAWLKTL